MNKKYFLLILIPVILFMFYHGNIKPLLASRAAVKIGPEKALAYNTFVNHTIRKEIAKIAIKSDDAEYVGFAINEMEKNIQERPLDAKTYILISYLYYRTGQDEKFKKAAAKAVELAPNRQDIKDLQNLLDK